MCDVAIIGAGPYGLSLAAHLKALGVRFRIIGNPMHTWQAHMPRGMRLKSEGFASSLYDPDGKFTLAAFCKERGIPYAKLGLPVPLEVFTAYGLEFQKRFVPELEDMLVTSLEQIPEGFRIGLEDGRSFICRRVVMAVGLTHYDSLPPELSGFPEHYVSHSSRHNTVEKFRGQEIAVVGAGASALDLAALLQQSGARVHVLARKSQIRFHDPPTNMEPSFLDQLRSPITGIGPGWKLFFCSRLPLLFHRMPVKFRLDRVKKILGPAPCWFTKEQVVGKVQLHVSTRITGAKTENGRVRLHLIDAAGAQRNLLADHVIAATGYKVDLDRLKFVDQTLRSSIRSVENSPVLSTNFESSVPGLYFVGVSAANSFGPLLRFAFGAGFASKRLARHLSKTKGEPIPATQFELVEKTEIRDEVIAR